MDYKSLAKEAALNFINKDIPLTTSISKIANDNSLNPIQIQRVAELSNKACHQYFLLKNADKNFTFPLATADNITPYVSDELVSSFEPKAKPSVEKIGELFGNPESQIDIKAVESVHAREKLAELLQASVREVESRIDYEKLALADAVVELEDTIKQMKLMGFQAEDIRQTLTSAQPGNADDINKIMKKIYTNISFTPSAPPENAVVNEYHPLTIKVRNTFAKNDSVTNLENAKRYLSTKIDLLKEVHGRV